MKIRNGGFTLNRHAESSFLSISTTQKAQGRDPEQKLFGMALCKGFTLIEVLIVVLIIGVLVAIAVPQYQKAVLKSRFSSLMPTTQAVRDGNEMYFMTNGRYADALAKLDVTTTNTEDMTITLSDDSDYAYTLATRPNIKNNLIMYQKHSANFPGEIHCEALSGNKQAKWLCEKGLHAVKNIGEVVSDGYDTYVIEGTGQGLNRAQVEAALTATTCDKAYASGASTCNITDNTTTNGKTKQVCYSINGTNDYCITTEFSESNQQTKRTVCASGECYEYEYNEDGNKTSWKYCFGDNMSSDGKSCNKYDGMADYSYDEAGNQTSYKSCGIISSDGKTCDKYGNIYDYGYDVAGNKTSEKSCYGSNLSSNGKTCDKYNEIREYGYDATGNQTSYKYCSGSNRSTDGKTCDKYNNIYDYGYDTAGNRTSSKSCYGTNTSQSTDGKTCDKYYTIYDYGYDTAGNQTSEKYCYGNLISDGKTCDKYNSINEYGYDAAGNKTSLKSCHGDNLSSDGKTCDKYNQIYDFGYDPTGNQTSHKVCYGDNFSSDGKTCDKYDEIEEYGYDAAGNQTSYKYCDGDNVSSDGKTCNKYNEIDYYGYDESGYHTYERYCWDNGEEMECDDTSYNIDG